MKILIIGGTGVISSYVTKQLAENHEVFVLNRGHHPSDLPVNVTLLTADVMQPVSFMKAMEGLTFDCVIDFIAFSRYDVKRDIGVFAGKIKQYIFISSATCYERPVSNYRITEDTPIGNSYWDYAQGKIDCEEELMNAYHTVGFPVTIVRPSYTYSQTTIPHIFNSRKCRFTIVDRILRGKQVIVPGDGTSLFTLTHSRDFARGFVGLVGNLNAIGEVFHITSDEVLTWDQITQMIAEAVGKKAKILHVPSDVICDIYPNYSGGLRGDKIYSMVMDNTKIKKFVPGFQCHIPFREGIAESIEYFMKIADTLATDHEFNFMCDELIYAMDKLESYLKSKDSVYR